ncbi:MAG TPA: cache domain-containing protein [Patescibacteria group bacterium]|nr:cache domain-containing protein [Patescibacteria group bacterium]
MLQIQFLLINAHFTINLLVALVCFAVAWLYFDAWLGRKDIREGTKMLGFLFLSLSFIVHSTYIEQTLLETSLIGVKTIEILTVVFRTLGYLVLISGQIIDPLQPLPTYRSQSKEKGFGIKNPKAHALLILGSIPLLDSVNFLFPVLAIITAFLYIRRATLGLEFHLRTIGYSLTILSISELFHLASLFRSTDNINIIKLVGPFGPLWIIEHALLIFFMVILGRWVWSYLAKRLETQMFMIFTSVTLVVFLTTAVFFTSVSIKNFRDDILSNLKINVKVLQYTLESKKAETLSDSQVIAQNREIISAVSEKDRKKLADLTIEMLLTKKQDYLVVTDENGAILIRADDPEKAGGSLSDDPLVKRALTGEPTAGLITKEGVLAPTVSVRASSPVKNGTDTIGTVTIGTTVDNAYVDGLKDATGLDASIYADNVRSATTFIASDGKSRWVGIKEETEEVKKTVLGDGNDYQGSVNILNIPYLVSFSAIKSVDQNSIGMLFVGRPEVSTLEAAAKLIEQTFLVTVILLIVSTIPAYFISKYIIDQIKT